MEFGLTVGFPCALYALCPPKLKKGLNCVTCYVKCIERDIGDLVFPEAQDRDHIFRRWCLPMHSFSEDQRAIGTPFVG